MSEYQLFWGDFHKHLAEVERADEIIEAAKYRLDFYPVLSYPFRWELVNGLRVETVRQRPEFLEEWRILQAAARKHNREGGFVTFLGYEWHGNRSNYGDHNVIYRDEDNPLDDAWEIGDLFANLRQRQAIAIPHHTAYRPGNRGKRWEYFDPEISPVMEVFSSHGSSEGVDSPLELDSNQSMGPAVSGGGLVEALDRGYRVGVVASNDGAGLPGSWPRGIAGVWARELTRQAIWEALMERRTIAATGDRMKLWFSINGRPPGSVIAGDGRLDAEVRLVASQPVDRIELVHNGRVAETSRHRDRWAGQGGAGPAKILVEFGWGPAARYGFRETKVGWEGEIALAGGRLVSVEPRFTMLGQRFERKGENRCLFRLSTDRESGRDNFRQGLILEYDGGPESVFTIMVNGRQLKLAARDTARGSHLFPFLEDSRALVKREFGLDGTEFENQDVYYLCAPKVRVGRSCPEASWNVGAVFSGLPAVKGRNYYYVRAGQADGQAAWSSPIWVDR